MLLFGVSGAQSLNQAVYQPKYKDPVLQQLEEQRNKTTAAEDSITQSIRDRQKARDKQAEQAKISLRSDIAGVKKPASKDGFNKVQHFPPVAQYQSGMCWCFSGTSFLESEVIRQTGRKVKLSELHTIYYEYLEKAARFIRERGDSFIGEGSEVNAVFRVMKKYGAVPAEIYTGLPRGDKHDHTQLFEEIDNYLKYCKANDYWDETIVLNTIRVILNKYIGEPPQTFTFEGKKYTPREFLQNVLKLQIDDYCDVMSTMSVPFYTRAEFKVDDNWWHDSSYINIPLAEWYAALKKAINNGYSLAIGGDVSEPGYLGFEDVAFIPDFDIPNQYINQDARELRIYNETTTDDHGLHLVGYTRVDDRDWYLIKDSARSSRWGKYEGYYMYRDDYLKLKMLGFTVHKDVLKDILSRVK
ncbi:MAG: C1 family peptidase [Candidatus Neomarinimicrobiota bacterium]